MGVLDNKVAVIMGGTSGIGARTAELFAEEGARVVVAGRRSEEGEALARRLGPSVAFIRTDVTQESDVAAAVAHAMDLFGRLEFTLPDLPAFQRSAATQADLLDALRARAAPYATGLSLPKQR